VGVFLFFSSKAQESFDVERTFSRIIRIE